MKEILFIAAGTRGAKRVRDRFQPFVPIRGRYCVEYVLDAALGAGTIDRICVWGEKPALEAILEPAIRRGAGRGIEVWVLQEKDNFLDSFLFSYLHCVDRHWLPLDRKLLAGTGMGQPQWDLMRELAKESSIADRPVNLILSDTPLIRSEEIDTMVANKNPAMDLVFGRTPRPVVDALLARAHEPFCYEDAVKNYYHYNVHGAEVALIVNSFMAGRPLRVPGYIWNFAAHLFANRTIIEGGRFNLNKIRGNLALFRSVFSSVEQSAFSRNSYLRLKAFSFLVRAYLIIIKNKSAQRKFRDLALLEEKVALLTHCAIGYQIGDCAGMAMDIDTAYEIEYVDRFFHLLREG
ncbi:MAG: hypothetical protein HQM03_06360 [Magnetococcales bacterium]|nr:hypothetical protein [Magnetococcales bacterium]